jgi:hypothetical protein
MRIAKNIMRGAGVFFHPDDNVNVSIMLRPKRYQNLLT